MSDERVYLSGDIWGDYVSGALGTLSRQRGTQVLEDTLTSRIAETKSSVEDTDRNVTVILTRPYFWGSADGSLRLNPGDLLSLGKKHAVDYWLAAAMSPNGRFISTWRSIYVPNLSFQRVTPIFRYTPPRPGWQEPVGFLAPATSIDVFPLGSSGFAKVVRARALGSLAPVSGFVKLEDVFLRSDKGKIARGYLPPARAWRR